MQGFICKVCGGTLERQGEYLVCKFCRNKWQDEKAGDDCAIERVNAWTALRNHDFEKATELFDIIINKNKKDHEAYWGRALATNSIVYVDDYANDKKVPTCNNITETSFLKNKDYQKAIDLADKDIKESYKKQAEQIEGIRVEWLETARKEPEYDVFISFKDSDREHGIDRTKDSVDVQDLYTALVGMGYKVFFSRVTLRDKVSEHYEPYIYNAIKTAKVMIVFGEKAEYFNAVWVKNEWKRFKARLDRGEKKKGSLIAVYKDMDPYGIPTALIGGGQAIDYGIPSNFSVLTKHIADIVGNNKKEKKKEEEQISVKPEETREAVKKGQKYFHCPSCGTLLNKQPGFDNSTEEYLCPVCNNVLYHSFTDEDYKVKKIKTKPQKVSAPKVRTHGVSNTIGGPTSTYSGGYGANTYSGNSGYNSYGNTLGGGAISNGYSRRRSVGGFGRVKKWLLFLICVTLGWLGIHRLFQGKVFTAVIWALTGGVFTVGWFIDALLTLKRAIKDT